MRRRVKQVDVFTRVPFAGNPAAVVLDGRGLDDATMQAIAREMNVSETTFVLPTTTAEADYRVRIFTPAAEVPFAGHPTIATAFALLEEGRLAPGLVRQECGVGFVPVAIEARSAGPFFLMTQTPPRVEPIDLPRARCAAVLRCDAADLLEPPPEIVSTGLPWLIVPLRRLAATARLRPDLAAIEDLGRAHGMAGVTVFCLETDDPNATLHLRSFAPHPGVPEDPVCGSGNGAVAAYVARHGLLGPGPLAYVAEQGREVGRPGRVTVHASTDAGGGWVIQVGGEAVTVLEATLAV
jgi:PhzF family phenazine biosynthesis protein